MFKTLRVLQKYTVTLKNTSGQCQPQVAIGNLFFSSGGPPRNQYILNLPQVFPKNKPHVLSFEPDARTNITWETQTIATQPQTATVFHASPVTNNLDVYISPNITIPTLSLVETIN